MSLTSVVTKYFHNKYLLRNIAVSMPQSIFKIPIVYLVCTFIFLYTLSMLLAIFPLAIVFVLLSCVTTLVFRFFIFKSSFINSSLIINFSSDCKKIIFISDTFEYTFFFFIYNHVSAFSLVGI